MRKENLINVNATRLQQATGTNGRSGHLQEIKHGAWPIPSAPAWHEKFLPHKETRLMSEQSKGGVFVPYPLLAILTPALLIIMGGIVGLVVMVNSMNTTMLLRDADAREERRKLWEKIEQQEVYIHNDRERIGKLEERDRLEDRSQRRN